MPSVVCYLSMILVDYAKYCIILLFLATQDAIFSSSSTPYPKQQQLARAALLVAVFIPIDTLAVDGSMLPFGLVIVHIVHQRTSA